MAKNYPGLVCKNKRYLFRIGIPKHLWTLTKCKEIAYALGTSDLSLAIRKWKMEIGHYQQFINLFERICMEICKGQVILDNNDVDKVLLHRLSQIQFFVEENTEQLVEGTKTITDVRLYSPEDKKNLPKIEALMKDLIIDYLEHLIKHDRANSTLQKLYQRLKAKEVEFNLTYQDDSGYNWFQSLSNHVNTLEKYAEKSIGAIQEDKHYSPTNPKLMSLIRTYDSIKSDERMNKSSSRTPWDKLFQKYARDKIHRNNVEDKRITHTRHYIKIIFAIIGKQYLEELSEQDCRKVCDKIYLVPKGWRGDFKPGETISKILTGRNALSKSSIKEFLYTFKEFLSFAVKEGVIKNNFHDFIDIPKVEKEKRTFFTNKDLNLIFNPETYPDPHSRKNIADFWISLIALYQGCRRGEICQLHVSDIKMIKKIPCFDINDEDSDKSLKTKPSIRQIPIHPQLIQMGFLSYVDYQRRNKEKYLFPSLVHNKEGHGTDFGHRFASYLKRIGIKDKKKVFHSFRHTFTHRCMEVQLTTETENALGGWVNKGIGQNVYGGKLAPNILIKELVKVTFPIKKNLNILEKKYRDSYIFR